MVTLQDHDEGWLRAVATVGAEGQGPDMAAVLLDAATAVGRRWRGSRALEDVIDDSLWEWEHLVDAAGIESRREMAGVPALVAREAGDLPFHEMCEVAVASTHLMNVLPGTDPSDPGTYVFSGLSSRAIVTLREIALLLENGHAYGARSRWRALHEIVVVASVINRGDRHTAARYKNHRWVVLARERERTGVYEWDVQGPTPEQMRNRLVQRYGKPYEGQYGWAANISRVRCGTDRPAWRHLVRISGYEEHSTRVQHAHHSVHGGDSLGLLGTVFEPDGPFHTGATAHGVMEIAYETTRVFRQAMWELNSLRVRRSPLRKRTILASIVDSHFLNIEHTLAWKHLAASPESFAAYGRAVDQLLGNELSQ